MMRPREEISMIRGKLRVAEAARLVGVNAWTLRRLEALGRIPAPSRDPLCGYRAYTESDLNQIREALGRLADERTLAATA